MTYLRLSLLALGVCLVAGPSDAQTPVRLVSAEIGGEYESVSAGFADTRGTHGRLVLAAGGGTWRLEGAAQERFGEGGLLFGIGHTRVLRGRWVASGYVGGSSAGAFHARVRAGAELGRKWGARQEIVTTVGGWVYDARDVHRDAVFTAESAYYVRRWVVQVGGRLTLSTPGDMLGHYVYASLSHGRPGTREIVVRGGGGYEAYQLVGPLVADVGFQSWEAGASWLEPVGRGWALALRATAYRNPFYTRAGLGIGIARRF